MHSLEGIVKLNADDKALDYARALNLGGSTPDAPKSEEKTGKKHIRSTPWSRCNLFDVDALSPDKL